MPVTFDADEFDSALRQFNQSSTEPLSIAKSGMVMPISTRDHGDEFKLRIITARTKLKLMRDRSDALRDSLQRFRMQEHNSNRA